ncbi:unnamed protein product [Rhodiola kirilowii]
MNNNPEQAVSEKPMKQKEGEAGGILNKKIRSLKKLMMLKNNNKKMDRHHHHHPWKSIILSTSSSFRWKRVKTIHHSFFDNVVFKIMSVCEGVVLVSTVCFFFLCCGCHF